MTTGGRRVRNWRLVLCFVLAVAAGAVVVASLNQAALTGDTIVSAAIFALTSGSIYAIAASGLVVTYTTSGVFKVRP